MTAQVVRRVRLPADHSSPAAARAAVRSVVVEVGLTDLLDEALLLTTELATNAVVHARTDFEVEVVADAEYVNVTVTDHDAGAIARRNWAAGQRPPRGSDQLDERGRGLLLVDQMATYWGTVHHPEGKGVWFRLERTRTGDAAGASVAPLRSVAAAMSARAGSTSELGTVAAATLDALVLSAPAYDAATLVEIGDELLKRLCSAVGADGGAILVDEADGEGHRTVAAYGAPVPATGGLRVPLRGIRPWRGELALTTPVPMYLRSLVELTAERIGLSVENERLRRTDSVRRTWLTYLAEVSELLAQSLDVKLTLALIPRLVVPRLGRWCAVHVVDDLGELRLAAATHADESQMPELLANLEEALPVLREAQEVDAVAPLAAPVEGYTLTLSARGIRLGLLTVGRGAHHRLGAEELAVVEDVGRRAALAIDNARIHAERRSVAEALQRSLLPPALPEAKGIEFGAEYVPTGEGVDVGGDFYDVVSLADGRWLVVVGDVSGKGMQAAAVTGLVRDVTRVLVRDGKPLPDALARLNETLVERGGGRFCTLALAAVTPRNSGRLDVALYLAGHDRPVLVYGDGTTALVGDCGTALGLLDRVSSPRCRLSLAPGDTLVFYTDGVTERRRGAELYGVERLRREAALLAGFPAEVMAARLRTATLNFSPEAPRDDIAIFTLRNDVQAP